MISRREGQSDFLDKIADASVESVGAGVAGAGAGMKKTASSSITAEDVKTNHPASKVTSMTLHQARIARRSGKFVKVAGKKDLYQEIETKDFWKLSEDKKTVNRLFEENNGLAK